MCFEIKIANKEYKDGSFGPGIRTTGLGDDDLILRGSSRHKTAWVNIESMMLKAGLLEFIKKEGRDNLRGVVKIIVNGRLYAFQGETEDGLKILSISQEETSDQTDPFAAIAMMMKSKVSPEVIAKQMTMNSGNFTYKAEHITALCAMVRDLNKNHYLLTAGQVSALIEDQEIYGQDSE